MSELISLPSPEDRAAIETAVSVYVTAAKWPTRERMLKVIRAVLNRYNISKMSLASCTVHKSKPPGYAYIRGKSYVTGRVCPGCGAEIYGRSSRVRIISIREGYRQDDVSYGCRGGEVFRKREALS